MTRRATKRSTTALVAVVLCAAGLLFSTSAETARGTQLRSDHTDAVSLVRAEQERAVRRQAQVDELRPKVRARLAAEAERNGLVESLTRRADGVAPAAGLGAVSGPGLAVTLDDAPRSSRDRAGVKPDDLVVHQQDLQAVVNALWAGGAEAMTLMDQRVIATSAVRCVGNTLILQGRVYSPPYQVVALGDPTRLRAALDASPQVEVYRQYVSALDLGYLVENRGPATTFAAYSGPLDLSYARVPDGADVGAEAGGSPAATAPGSAKVATTPPRSSP